MIDVHLEKINKMCHCRLFNLITPPLPLGEFPLPPCLYSWWENDSRRRTHHRSSGGRCSFSGACDLGWAMWATSLVLGLPTLPFCWDGSHQPLLTALGSGVTRKGGFMPCFAMTSSVSSDVSLNFSGAPFLPLHKYTDVTIMALSQRS